MRAFLSASMLLCGAATLAAQTEAARTATDVAESGAVLRAELLASYDEAADKLVALVETIPAGKLDYRPARGTRSAGEVAMHVAAANFYFGRILGVAVPDDVSLRDLERERDKSRVMATLKRSIEQARGAIDGLSDAELDRPRDLGGGTRKSGRAVALTLVSHAHEHLGQLVAYARAVGVAPPWSS